MSTDRKTKNPLPTLRTERLILRPFTVADAPIVQRLAGAREIADTTLNIPHPYEDGVAEQWISGHQESYEQGKRVPLAITLTHGETVVGAISLMSLSQRDERAELGYWIGKDYWNNGYCTEAAREIVHFGFERLGLNRIIGRHLTRNSASGRVMQKIGMKREGTLRQHVKKWDRFEDMECYGILKEDEG
jgi:RimJ/RimL family protein N-acetyltransferase